MLHIMENVMSKHKGPVDPESLPYRPCVGLMVLNKAGLVWAGHRIVSPGEEMDGATQLHCASFTKKPA
jgi:putative (di)nucleoside polyphosphate hydrolase